MTYNESERLSAVLYCPECGSKNDGATSTTQDGETTYVPQDGDIGVCMYCATIITFIDNVTRLKKVSSDELVNLDIMHPGIAAQTDRTRWTIMEMRGID